MKLYNTKRTFGHFCRNKKEAASIPEGSTDGQGAAALRAFESKPEMTASENVLEFTGQ